MRIGETFFAGYDIFVIVAAVVAGVSILVCLSLGIASVFNPGMRAKLIDAIRPVFLGLVFCAVLFSLLRIFGSREFVVLTFSTSLLILLSARLARNFFSGALSAVVAYALTALALFFLTADLLASSISNTVFYALPIVLGFILFASAQSFEQSEFWKFSPAVAASGLLIAGGSMWVMFSRLADQWSTSFIALLVDQGVHWIELANALSGGVIALGMAKFGAYGEESRTSFIADVCSWMTRSQLKIFIIGAFLGLYFAVIRPAIADALSFMPLVEWAVVCLAVWYIYRSARIRIEAHSSSPFFPVWERYTPEMERVMDEDFAHLSRIQQAFVEEGQKDYLVVYLATLLNKMGVSQARTSTLLHPLIEYEDARSPWYPFNWNQAGIMEKNKQTRLKILGDVVTSLKDAAKEESREELLARRRRKYERLRYRRSQEAL